VKKIGKNGGLLSDGTAAPKAGETRQRTAAMANVTCTIFNIQRWVLKGIKIVSV
jgi:hypothetical protein